MTHGDPPRQPHPVVRWVGLAEQLVGGLLLVVILVLVLIQVAQRFLPGGGWAWTGELARYSLVWLTFALAGHLMARGEHITLYLVDYAARGRALRVIQIFANLVVAVVALGFANEAAILVLSPSSQATPALGIPLTTIYVVPLVGFVLTAVSAVLRAILGDPQPATDTQQAAEAERVVP